MFCRNDVPVGKFEIRMWTVIQGGLPCGVACEVACSCLLMALINVTHEDVPSRSVHSTVLAAISSPQDHTGCPVQLSKLSNTFLYQRLAAMESVLLV